MWYFLYRVLLLLAYPLVRLRLHWRARREPEYGERIEERFGWVPASVPRGVIWFHTVSAGEASAAAPIIAELRGRYPDTPFLVTTMTPAGSEQIRNRFHGQSARGDVSEDGDRAPRPVAHCYAPYDFPCAMARFFDRVQPRLVVLMETELWPNLLARAGADRVPTLLVNARLSARSAAGYRRLGGLTRAMLGGLTMIACQYPEHADRFLALGAAPDRVDVLGSVKFDLALPADAAERVAALRRRWDLHGRRTWIAGSTHPGEDAVVLDAHRRLCRQIPGARLLLVPRHPSRCGAVAALCRAQGFSVARQSETALDPAGADVIIGDVMGQLLYLYGLSEVAFLGGSLVPVGGHNPIEPALWGQPLLTGPQVFNFSDVAGRFADAGCLTIVTDAEALAAELGRYLADDVVRGKAAAAARQVVAQNRGASQRLLALLGTQIDAAIAQ